MDTGNWRQALGTESRQKIVKRIMDTLQKHMPHSGQEGMNELLKIAWRFEEKIFQTASDQQDYLRRISVKMLSLESKSQNNMNNPGNTPADSNPMVGGSALMSQQQPQQQTQQQNPQLNTQNQQQNPQQQPQIQPQPQQLPQLQQQQPQIRSQAPGSIPIPNPMQNPQRPPQMLNNGSMQTMPMQTPQQASSLSGLSQNPHHQNTLNQSALTQNTLSQNAISQNQAAAMRMMQARQQQQQSSSQQTQPTQQGQPQTQQTSQGLPQQGLTPQMLLRLQQKNKMVQQSLQKSSQQVQQLQHPQQLQNQSNLLQQQSQFLQTPQQQQQHMMNAQALHQQQLLGNNSQQMLQQQMLQQNNLKQQQQQNQGVGINQQQQLEQKQQQQQQQLLQQRAAVSEASSVDSGQTAQSTVDDQQELVWTKLQNLKAKYFQDMSDLLKMLVTRSQQQTMPTEQLQKLNHYREVLTRMIPYLNASRSNLPKEFKLDKLEAFEKQIVSIMETFKKRRVPQQQQQQQQQMQQQNMMQQQQNGNQMYPMQQHPPSSMPVQQQIHPQPLMQSQQQQPNVMNPLHNLNSLQQTNILNKQQELFQQQRLFNQDQIKQRMLQMEDSKADIRRIIPGKQRIHGSPQLASSPQILQAPSPPAAVDTKPGTYAKLSPQPDQQSLSTPPLTVPKAGTPMQATTPPFMTPSPLLQVSSPPIEEPENKLTPSSNVQTYNHSSSLSTPVIGTPGISASPFLEYSPSSTQVVTTQDGTPLSQKSLGDPLERLVKVMGTMSQKALNSAVREMKSVISLSDKLAASAPGPGCKAAVGEDLAALTKCRLQARALACQEGGGSLKRRHFDSVPVSVISSDGSVANSLHRGEDDEASVVTSQWKRHKPEVHSTPTHAVSYTLEQEIRETNENLIDTTVDISEDSSDEGKEGVVVTFSYIGIEVPLDKSDSASSLDHMEILSPLRLLVPPSYPKAPPSLLPDYSDPNSNHALSVRVREAFNRAVRHLNQPLTIKAMAKAWDECARSAVAEDSHHGNSGSFISSFGVWESCIA